MDRATIKALAISMLQNRTAVQPAHIDAILDSVFSHLLVDECEQLARRGVEVVVTVNGQAQYTLDATFRSLDADYAYLDSGERLTLYNSREAWLQLGQQTGSTPTRVLLFYDSSDARWKVLLSPTPSSVININIPATFYRGVVPAEVPDLNEAMALVFGTAMQIALISALDDIVTAAQAGLKTMVGQMKTARVASDRFLPNQLPPRRDF